jgi:HEAT repeat protein
MTQEDGGMDRETALRELRKGDGHARRQAARVLGRWPDDEVLVALVDGLHDADRAVRDAATDTLIEVGDERAARLLVALLRSPVPAVRNAARPVLEQLGKAAPEILEGIARDPDARMRIFAADILAGTGDHDRAPLLISLLDDADENVRDAAIVALGRLGAPEAVARLESFAGTAAPWIRFSAIDALGRIPGPEAREALERLLPAAPADLRGPIGDAIARQGVQR